MRALFGQYSCQTYILLYRAFYPGSGAWVEISAPFFFFFPRSVTNRRLVSKAHASPVHAYNTQSRSQSLRYPCPAERETEHLWDKAFSITGFWLFRLHCAGVSV